MPHSFDAITFVAGDFATLQSITSLPALRPFSPEVIALLDTFSRLTRTDVQAREWPDVVSLGFWCRQAATMQMRDASGDLSNRLGRGVVFHIAPGNVPVNFAYSLFSGLLTGNANIVRLPGHEHPQTAIVLRLLNQALAAHASLAPYVILVRYDKQTTINDALSALCETRIIWGGDQTIAQLRRSPLPARALDIAFADRYSIAIIHAERYLAHDNKTALAQAFFNDTLLNDQNACSSPSLVVWLGENSDTARDIFWQHFETLAVKRYTLEPVSAVNKLTQLCLLSTQVMGAKKVQGNNNLLVRVQLPSLSEETLSLRGNCGFFMEYVGQTLDEIVPLCDSRCQTLAVFGIDNREVSDWISRTRPKGIDRIVPFGRTLDFTLHWDGYDLVAMLTRVISCTG